MCNPCCQCGGIGSVPNPDLEEAQHVPDHACYHCSTTGACGCPEPDLREQSSYPDQQVDDYRRAAGEVAVAAAPSLESLSDSRLRELWVDALRGLTYDNATAEAVKAAVEERLDEVEAGLTAVEYTRAIRTLRMPCRRCAGTGQFVTYVENGRPRGPGGICFRCGGRGTQTWRDGHRNAAADVHAAERALRG